MSLTPEDVKNSFGGQRCFNKVTGKIGFLAIDKIKKASGNFYCFNVEAGKLDDKGQKVTIEEMWNISDVTILGTK